MGWSINLITNEPIISKECAQELFEAQLYPDESYGEIWEDLEDVLYKKKLCFNSDHQEHMDFLSDETFLNILKKHKIKGDITFADLEQGDPIFWGYRFDGEGNFVKLKGNLSYEPIK